MSTPLDDKTLAMLWAAKVVEDPDHPEAIPGDDTERLFKVVRQAIVDLDDIHRPQGVPGQRRCTKCSTPEWPCSSRMVADDLRFMLESIE